MPCAFGSAFAAPVINSIRKNFPKRKSAKEVEHSGIHIFIVK